MRPSALTRVIALFALGLTAFSDAHAHKPSDAYLTLRVTETQIEGQWDIALRDLDLVLGLDADRDGALTWGEVRARHRDIAAYALSRLSLNADRSSCELLPLDQLIDRHSDGAYSVLRFTARCGHEPAELQVTYRLLFDVDPQHRGLLKLDYAGHTRTAILSPEQASQQFGIREPHRLQQFLAYFQHGVWHIWIGFDHILFLISLLLPAVLVRTGTQWQPAGGFRHALLDVVSVVTAFTAAHSMTLTLSALGVVSPPSRLVESAIAVSVALAALNNLIPVVSDRRWVLAFVFGLVHGFGFASVLIDLGLPRATLLSALLGFNLGVEAGQLAVVSLFLPIAWRLRATWAYKRVALLAGSVAVMLLASIWFAQRAFDLRVWS